MSISTSYCLPNIPYEAAGFFARVRGRLEAAYLQLPPIALKGEIAVVTKVPSGWGDLSASAKAIQVMKRAVQDLKVVWFIYDQQSRLPHETILKKAREFVGEDPNVRIFSWPEQNTGYKPIDLILSGPVMFGWDARYMGARMGRTTTGSHLNFLESAMISLQIGRYGFSLLQEKGPLLNGKIHESLFSQTDQQVMLPMGLEEGTGILLDDERIRLSSEDDCNPAYLLNLTDKGLQADILQAMGGEFDRTRCSFNLGYVQRSISAIKFIVCVAIQEKTKDAVIVFNQNSSQQWYDLSRLKGHLMNCPEEWKRLQKAGFKTLIFKDGNEQIEIRLQEEGTKNLTVLLRPFFCPEDMKWMQLAAQRMVVTGNNSPAEAFSARCQLYLYEDVDEGGCNYNFLMQQVDLASKISPDLGKLLSLFGGDQRLKEQRQLNQSLNPESWDQMERILDQPHLGKNTLDLCNEIVQHYSFAPKLEAIVRRTLWLQQKPELKKVEIEAMGQEFYSGIVAWFRDHKIPGRRLNVPSLEGLGSRLLSKVEKSGQ